MEKIKIPQIFLNIFLILIIAAYAFIFNSLVGRVDKNELNIDRVNPVLLQIQTDLSAIKTNLEWLMKNK